MSGTLATPFGISAPALRGCALSAIRRRMSSESERLSCSDSFAWQGGNSLAVQTHGKAMSAQKRRPSRGFTLIEMMVTLTILAILALVGVPSMTGFIISNRMTSYANDVLAALNLARSEAVRRNQRVVFCPVAVTAGVADTSACVNPGAGAWAGWMVFEDTQVADGARQNTEEVIRSGVFGGGASQIMASGNLTAAGNRIAFRPDGVAKAHGNNAVQQVALRICDSSSDLKQNARDINMVFGSRISVVRTEVSACGVPADPN